MYFDSIWEGEYRFGPKTAEDQKKHKTAVKLATAYFQSLQTYMAGYSGNRYEMTARISEANFEHAINWSKNIRIFCVSGKEYLEEYEAYLWECDSNSKPPTEINIQDWGPLSPQSYTKTEEYKINNHHNEDCTHQDRCGQTKYGDVYLCEEGARTALATMKAKFTPKPSLKKEYNKLKEKYHKLYRKHLNAYSSSVSAPPRTVPEDSDQDDSSDESEEERRTHQAPRKKPRKKERTETARSLARPAAVSESDSMDEFLDDKNDPNRHWLDQMHDQAYTSSEADSSSDISEISAFYDDGNSK